MNPAPSSFESFPITFGDYDLLRRIAFGGMAEVFLAQPRRNGLFQKDIAIKRILPHLSAEASVVKMFLDEARIASHLSHPNVVQVFDFGEVQGRHYLAMEYLRGETLGALIQEAWQSGRPVPVAVALQIAIAVCDGLHYAHTFEEAGQPLQLVHRDLSPSNIMITYHGEVKVLDFGVAHAAGRFQEQTRAGFVKGKMAYCSPEQLQGERFLDARSDIFSLAVVLHELLTGQSAFERGAELKTGLAVTQERLPALKSLRADVPPGLERVLDKALEKPRQLRWPSTLALREALETIVGREPVRLGDYLRSVFGDERATTPLSALQKSMTPAGRCVPVSNGSPSSPRNEAATTLARTPMAPGTSGSTPGVSLRTARPSGSTPGISPRSAATPVKTACPHATTCELFPAFKVNSILNVWKVSFCEADYTKCARHKLSIEGKRVPLNLLPNGSSLNLENRGGPK